VAQVTISRVVIIAEVDASHCRHTITGSVSVRVPAVGRLVEKYVMENTVAAMNLLDTVVRRQGTKHHCLPCFLLLFWHWLAAMRLLRHLQRRRRNVWVLVKQNPQQMCLAHPPGITR
jgi:hypothetical protein